MSQELGPNRRRPGILFGFLVATVLVAHPAIAGVSPADDPAANLFRRDNLVAWCIVPFDSKKRDPEARAAMLERLGFKHFAYDWRAEHVPTFDAELDALAKRGVALDAFWAAGELNDETRRILDVLKRHQTRAQLWVLLGLGEDKVEGDAWEQRVQTAVAKLRPLADEAGKIGCTLALYNHGGWFGEPENQIAILDRLKAAGVTNVGVVYNLHHGHDQLDRFPAILQKLKPHLVCLNLNGMDKEGDKVGRKILPLGQGALDLGLLKIIRDSGYTGPIGILGHTNDDAEERLRDNLDGLDWLVPQLDGKPAGPRPTPRTPVPPAPQAGAANGPDQAAAVRKLLADARATGDAGKGAEVFASPRFGCVNCHKVGNQGALIGPELTTAGLCLQPEAIVESFLWPRKEIKPGYEAWTVATTDGKIHRGYLLEQSPKAVALKSIETGDRVDLERESIDEMRLDGSVMPEGLAESMTPDQRRDVVRFLLDLGKPEGRSALETLGLHTHGAITFPYNRGPLRPDDWPNWRLPVNRDRIYDFYAKQAEFFRQQPSLPPLLPAYPGLDGGKLGHWGNQNEDTWADDRWNRTRLDAVMSGTFRGAGVTVPKGICVRLGDAGELAACFDPETLCYEAVWEGGFVQFDGIRHGFMGGLKLAGQPLPRPEGTRPEKPFEYRGFYRHGKRVVFAYRIDGVDYLDAPWVEDGRFTRQVAPADGHPLAGLIRGGPANWPEILETRGELGTGRPYAVDTIRPPFENPWNALLFFGDHDFGADGTAFLATMHGDVWRVEGLDATLEHVRWRRYASGLYHALGLVVAEGSVYVLGRDQITRLHDLNNDGEADYYECFSNRYATSPGGHDFICGLQRDALGRFYTASSTQGVIRIGPKGDSVEVLATGFRNPDGLGLTPDGSVTVPCSEGEWTPSSMICEIRPGGFYGYRGPQNDQPPDLPLVYLPRGLDNSSGGQVAIPDNRWGPLAGKMVHLSFGAGSHFLLLRETVDGQPQGAVVPLPGEFQSGVHRGRFHPVDGQLYVSGMAGWGSYTPADGCFQRVRYTGDPVQLPAEFHAHENGILVRFTSKLKPAVANDPRSHLAQVWNYRYSPGYGSLELSPRHPGLEGHDPLPIRSARVVEDGRALFLEIPDLQPVNQLQLHMKVDDGPPLDLFATVHKLAAPYTGFDGYQAAPKTIAAHPILADMARLKIRPEPNPHARPIAGARAIEIRTGPNLSFATRTFTVRPGEPIKLTLHNPDAVPHNWALIRPGTLPKVGEQVNKIIADPDAALRQYVPRSDDVLAYTDIVDPQAKFTIHFQAPAEPGRYPYLCTFPGHWMVMNGEMIVAPAEQ